MSIRHMNDAQNGIRNNTTGPKHQLLDNRAVDQDYKTRKANLNTAWIDSRKPMTPHMDTGALETIQGKKCTDNLHQGDCGRQHSSADYITVYSAPSSAEDTNVMHSLQLPQQAKRADMETDSAVR